MTESLTMSNREQKTMNNTSDDQHAEQLSPTTYTPGDFGFMKSKMWAKSCADGYNAVEQLGLWSWLSTYEPAPDRGFMFTSHPNLDRITNALVDNPHSGASWACMMRSLQYIAQNGWVSFVLKAQ